MSQRSELEAMSREDLLEWARRIHQTECNDPGHVDHIDITDPRISHADLVRFHLAHML